MAAVASRAASALAPTRPLPSSPAIRKAAPSPASLSKRSSTPSTTAGASPAPAPSASKKSSPKSGEKVVPTVQTSIRLGITARTKDRHGRNVPEVNWIIGSGQQLWEVLRRWALEVLRLPEKRFPGGATPSAAALEKKGIAACGREGPLPLDARLSDVIGELGVKSGARWLAVEWPATALPAEWRKPREKKPAAEGSKGGAGVCGDCGGSLGFRKARSDGGFRTLAICFDCNSIKGAINCGGGGGGGRGRSRSRAR